MFKVTQTGNNLADASADRTQTGHTKILHLIVRSSVRPSQAGKRIWSHQCAPNFCWELSHVGPQPHREAPCWELRRERSGCSSSRGRQRASMVLLIWWAHLSARVLPSCSLPHSCLLRWKGSGNRVPGCSLSVNLVRGRSGEVSRADLFSSSYPLTRGAEVTSPNITL